VLAKALAKAPADRYQTCVEFAAALRRACECPAEAAAHPETAGPHRPAAQPAQWAGLAGARIRALQTDGTVKPFQGNYTVHDAVITQFSVQPVG
jgi:hypothetical protein